MTTRALVAIALAVGLGATLTACKKDAPADGTGASAKPQASASAEARSIYDLTVKRLDGSPAPLSEYKGKVALLVNVASECGYTPQYTGLEALYEEMGPKGFVILAFPSNDFGAQEPGSPTEIAAFASSKYHVTFPMFEKVKTTGSDASPIYSVAAEVDGPPKWNFHKYLADKSGRIVKAFPSKVKPESDELKNAIRALL